MRSKALSLVLSTLLLASFGAAYELDDDEKQEIKDVVNSNTEDIPDPIANLIGDDKVNFVIDNGDSKNHIGVTMDGKEVDSIENSRVSGAVADITVEEDALEKLMRSDTPVADAKEMYKNETITVEKSSVTEKQEDGSDSSKSEETEEGDNATENSITGNFGESVSSGVTNAVDTVKVSVLKFALGL